MKKIEKLTPEQEALLPAFVDYGLQYGLNTSPCDRPKAEAAIRAHYAALNRPEPKLIIWLDSPHQGAIGAAMLAGTKFSGDQVRVQVWAQVWDQVRDQVGDQVWDQVRDQVGAQVRDQVPSTYINYSDYGWVSFYEYFRRHTNIKFPKKLLDKFDSIAAGLKSGIYEIYPHKGLCVGVRPPEKIFRDEHGRIHNTEGPAIRFRDGFSVYAIHGRRLPAWIWERRDTITREEFLQEKNAEVRGGMYAVLGQKRVFDLIGAEEVARESANNETYILYRTKERIGGKFWQWVGVKCPSTGTDYLLGVPDSVTSPMAGASGTWGLQKEDYIINQHT